MKTSLLLVFALLLTLSPVSRAQDDAIFCGNLSAPDCDLLAANRAAMRTLETAAYNLSLSFSGFTESNNDYDLMLTSAGAMHSRQDALLSAFPAMLDAASMDELLASVEPALNSPSAEGQIRIAVPAEDSEQPAAFSAQVRLTGGHVYLTSLFLQLMVPGLERGQWLDLDLLEASELARDLLDDPARLQALAEALESRGLPLPPGDLSDGDLNGVPFAQVAGHFIQTGQILNRELFSQPHFQSRFRSIQRLPDQTVDGTPVAMYETSLDYATLVDADAFRQAIEETLTLMASHELSPDAIEQAEDLLLELLAAQQTTITRTIRLSDHFTDSVTVTWSLELDTAITAGTLSAPRTATIVYEQRLSDHNQPVTIEAPENTRSLLDLLRGFLANGN